MSSVKGMYSNYELPAGFAVYGFDPADDYERPVELVYRNAGMEIKLDLSLLDAVKLRDALNEATKHSTPERPEPAVCRCDVGDDDMQLCPIHGSDVQ